MAAKKTSISVKPRDLLRFQQAAEDRGLSLSAFLVRCANDVLDEAAHVEDLKSIGADLRADLNRTLSRLTELAALAADRERASMEEQRQLLSGFLTDLHEQQVQTVKKAVAAGQGPGRASFHENFPPPTRPLTSYRTTPNQD